MSKFGFCAGVCLLLLGVVGVASADEGFSWKTNDEQISLFDGEDLVFSFNYAFMDHANVPKNEPRRFAGDYIYPLYGVCGENLTEDAPKDHYHHHGMFWTWPGVFVHQEDGSVKQYDLWTSNTNIRQRFLKVNTIEAGKDRAVLEIENGWFIDGKSTTPDQELDASKKGFKIAENEPFYGEKVMSEVVRLTVYPVETVVGVKSRSIDFELTLTPTTKAVSLQGAEKKSYGGLTIRFHPKGNIGVDKFITTDEGVAKEDMPEKNLRWADYTSRFGAVDPTSGKNDKLTGAAIFLSPNFPDFPPTWLTRYYGPICLGFPGVVAKRFEPQVPIVMKARIWTHEGLVSPEDLKNTYEKWAETEK